jgi:Fe-S cluster biogenesis protein NfuA
MAIFGKKKPPADVERRINDAIVGMRPLLHIEKMDLALLSFDATTGVTILRIAGDCPDCTMTATELRAGIEAHLRLRVPEITEVRNG